MFKKRVSKLLILGVIISSLGVVMVGTEMSEATPQLKADRVGGKDRIETSIEISKKAGVESVKTAILVGYDGEVDALTGTSLAKKLNGRVFMTKKDEVDKWTLTEMNKLGVKDVVILGGESVVSKNVEISLEKDNGFNVRRLAGNDREDTALKVAKEIIGDKEGNNIFITQGYESYADALSIGPVSARLGSPILLVSKGDRSSKNIDKWMNELYVDEITIIGGESVVSKDIEKQLRKYGRTRRVAGVNREETSIKIANEYSKDSKATVIANGYSSADAVVGGYFANEIGAPIILTPGNRLQQQTYDYLYENRKETVVLGLYSAVSKEVEDDINSALSGEKREIEVIEESIPFKIVEEKDNTLEVGVRKVKTKGINGKKEVTNRVIYTGDKVRKEKISEKIIKAPVNEVVLVGTRPRTELVRDEKLEKALKSKLTQSQHSGHYQVRHKDGTGQIPRFDKLFTQFALGDISHSRYQKTMDDIRWKDDGDIHNNRLISKSSRYVTKESNHQTIVNKAFNEFAGYGLDYVNTYALYNLKTKVYTISIVVGDVYGD